MKRPKSPVKSNSSALRSQFRIIGGIWRSRRFHFPPTEGLRPTPDRVRETVFNWLEPHLKNSTCLDLFCGSGALGLEALSRGAAHCTFIDAELHAINAIKGHLATLHCDDALVTHAQLPAALTRLTCRYDLIFLDPPYTLNCLNQCLGILLGQELLNEGAMIYVECSSMESLPEIPLTLNIHRHKIAGQVQYALLQYTGESSKHCADPL